MKKISNVEKKVKKEKKITKRKIVDKPRNAGEWTESQFWGKIRANLRSQTRFWIPRLNALKNARRPSQSTSNRRLKWEFKCAHCQGYYQQSFMEVHHTEEAGSLKCAQDLPRFVERLFAEDGWLCLCIDCHKKAHEQIKEKL